MARSESSKSWGLGSPGTSVGPTHYVSLTELLSLPRYTPMVAPASDLVNAKDEIIAKLEHDLDLE
eukprot:840292-Karenia_brevis.AAC.1